MQLPDLVAQDVEAIVVSVNQLWLVMAAFLVFFMQAGFALVEAGFTRAKNAGNIVMKNFMDFAVGALVYWAVGFMKNFMDFAVGALVYWAVGFGLAYGGTEMGRLVATGHWFVNDPGLSSTWLFQAVFAGTAATIVSGAMAERTKFSAYLLSTPFITGLIYPIVTNWVWGNGWLSPFAGHGDPVGPTGMLDFAGSGVVHLVGGTAALAGVLVIGPRLGKYDDNGEARPIPGHSLTLGALGVFILWFGWFGFNAGSTLCAVDCDFASAAVTTTLAGAAGAVAAMFAAWRLPAPRKPDVGLTLNGALAGLVGITAGAGYVNNLSAVLIGAVAGVVLVFSVIAMDRLHIDDPVGAISVHGTAGIWGVLAVGLFAEVELVEALGLSSGVGGLLVGGGAELLLTQVVGMVAIVSWTLLTSLTVFKLIERLHGLRVRPDEELGGLDHWEHGSMAYPEFMELARAELLVTPIGAEGARRAKGGNGGVPVQPLHR